MGVLLLMNEANNLLKNNKNKDNDIYPYLYVGINRMCTYAFFQPVMCSAQRANGVDPSKLLLKLLI